MTIHNKTIYWWRCDACSTESPSSRDEGGLMHHLERRGWLYAKDFYGYEYVLCPDCAKKPLPDFWPK